MFGVTGASKYHIALVCFRVGVFSKHMTSDHLWVRMSVATMWILRAALFAVSPDTLSGRCMCVLLDACNLWRAHPCFEAPRFIVSIEYLSQETNVEKYCVHAEP